jgi:uncharacterized Fe-S cluster protein YjdI
VLLDRAGDARTQGALRVLRDLATRSERGASAAVAVPAAIASNAASAPAQSPPAPERVDGVDHIEGKHLTLVYEGKKCIHARFCVTGAPTVFLANVKGPWIHPDAMDVDALVEIAHACPSGAIRYRRKDGKPDETPPPVNLLATREAGPYAVRGDLRIDGGAPTKPDMLETRDGALTIDPLSDGPLQIRGNLEITSGTGRVVARVVSARLCRCGASGSKPFCDGSHARVGFRSS